MQYRSINSVCKSLVRNVSEMQNVKNHQHINSKLPHVISHTLTSKVVLLVEAFFDWLHCPVFLLRSSDLLSLFFFPTSSTKALVANLEGGIGVDSAIGTGSLREQSAAGVRWTISEWYSSVTFLENEGLALIWDTWSVVGFGGARLDTFKMIILF